MNLAIIPARGGSKRIPRKNIRDFCGRPMISYAINTAIRSGLFEHIVVSTDDDEIALLAQQLGVETPFIRPAELAGDFTATVPVIAHGIENCHRFGWTFDQICCIYPCVPFIQSKDLVDALAQLKSSDVDYCFPVTEYPSQIQRALKISSEGKLQSFYPKFELTRTQDLELAYYDAGQFYWGNTNAWLTNPNIHSSGVGHVIPNWRVVDIDTPDDWHRAELIYQAINHNTETIQRQEKK